MRKMVSAGKMSRKGWLTRPIRASLAREPKDGMGMDTPIPMKERKLSVNIAEGICIAAVMIMTLMQLGTRCLKMMRLAPAPEARAASTNSCSLMDRICPLTWRAIPTQ